MKSKEAMKKNIAIGAKIPDFTLPDTAGNKVNVFEFAKGKKYVLVTFWASWCGPCRKEFKQLKELYAEYKDKGFDILAVSVDGSRAKWVKAINDDELPWTNVCEQDFSAKSVARSLFGISSVPYGFLIDGKGRIVQHGSCLDGVIKIYMNK
jgi:peroxiredoxin